MKQTKQFDVPVIDRPKEIEPGNGYVRAGSSTERSVVEWYWLLWDRRHFLGRVTIRGLILVTIIALLIPSRYQSSIRLMPADQNTGSGLAMLAALAGRGGSGSLGGLGSLGSLASDLLGTKTSGALFADILRGPTVQDAIIQRFDLRRVYWDRYWQDARKDLSKYTDIDEDRKSGVLTITVTDRNRARAQQIAGAYVEQLDRLVAQVSTSSARRERIFIEQRLQTVKQDLDNASREFSQYASKNGTLDMTAQTKAMVEGAARLQGELIAAQSELEGLQQIYTANNIRVQSLRARVAELKRQMDNMSGDSAAPDSTNSQVAGEFPSIRKLPLLGVRWADLYRQTKIEETVYELLTQQYEIAKIQEAREIPTVKVLDPATWPEKHSSPKRWLILLLGLAFAVSFGAVWILGEAAWQRWDPVDRRKVFAAELGTATKTQFVRVNHVIRNRFSRNGREVDHDYANNNNNDDRSERL